MGICCIGACIKASVIIGFYLVLYLLLEVIVAGTIICLSAFIVNWSLQTVRSLSTIEKHFQSLLSNATFLNIYHACLVCWFIGVFTLMWVKRRPLLTPKSLQHFQEVSHPLLCAWLKSVSVLVILVGGTYLQVSTFFVKFYGKGDREGEEEPNFEEIYRNENDLKFLGSLYVLVYLLVRTFSHYRDVSRMEVEIRLGEEIPKPRTMVYVEHFYAILGYELFVTDLVILVFLGFGVILQSDNSLHHWFPYVCCCFIGVGLGIVLGDMEERLPFLDNIMEKHQPYYRAIHWDVRLALLNFFLLPLLSLGYFQTPLLFQVDGKAKLLHNSLHLAFLNIIWMTISKGNTLFSYVVRGHFWHSRRHLLAVRHRQNGRGSGGSQGTGVLRNRIAPRNMENGEIGEPEGERGSRGDDVCNNAIPGLQNPNPPRNRLGAAHVLKNAIFSYFPVGLRIRKEDDRRSVSTGTCTSLLHRQNNSANLGALGVQLEEGGTCEVQRGLPDSEISRPESDQKEDEGTEEQDFLGDVENNLVCHETMGAEELKGGKVTFSADVKEETLIRLKRCPSTVLPVTLDDSA